MMKNRKDHPMKYVKLFASTLFAATLLVPVTGEASQAFAAAGYEAYMGEKATAFANSDEAVAALKAALMAKDLDAAAKLLGLDPAKLKAFDGIGDRMEELSAAAHQHVSTTPKGEGLIVALGHKVWPFPFPLVKNAEGQWAFDTAAGLEEIVARRIGENELAAIATMRAYVDAQRDYAAADRDGDGVVEYAQKLVSSEGLTDGLYWPIEQGDGESPAGPNIDPAALDRAKEGDGYFGYHFRILRAQGNKVAGGRYHYVINGNMIAGFGLIAWPARYAETGVNTFVVNHAGIVYEKDLGPDTAEIVNEIRRFNPSASWNIVND